MDTSQIDQQFQECYGKVPAIILGSGSSMPYGLPSMNELENHLLQNIVVSTKGNEQDQWTLVRTCLSQGDHLEAALEKHPLPETLLKEVVRHTWECVNKSDVSCLGHVSSNDNQIRFVLGDLLRALFRSTQNKLDIITTNYDRLAEYACNQAELIYWTGFTPGYIQYPQAYSQQQIKSQRVVNIWKVHGSLDWFRNKDGNTIGVQASDILCDDCEPLIVTPGIGKFKETHEEPFRNIITQADTALDEANSILCVGYGFRDGHIHTKIKTRCEQANIPLVVLARELTDEAKEFLKELNCNGHWIAIEESGSGSKVYTAQHSNGIDLAEADDMWNISGFMKSVECK